MNKRRKRSWHELNPPYPLPVSEWLNWLAVQELPSAFEDRELLTKMIAKAKELLK